MVPQKGSISGERDGRHRQKRLFGLRDNELFLAADEVAVKRAAASYQEGVAEHCTSRKHVQSSPSATLGTPSAASTVS
jgi:hypothetical protein